MVYKIPPGEGGKPYLASGLSFRCFIITEMLFLLTRFYILDFGVNSNYVPPTEGEGGGTYCFWCGSLRRRRWRCSLSARYLLNQWVDFDKTCTGTLSGGRKEVIRFLCPWPHFEGHTSTLKFSAFLHLPVRGFWPNFIYCNFGMF